MTNTKQERSNLGKETTLKTKGLTKPPKPRTEGLLKPPRPKGDKK